MLKKIWLTFMIIATFMLAACATETESIILPDLAGMTEEQARTVLSAFPVSIQVETVLDNNFPAGRFVRYGEGLAAEDVVEANATVILYFALHDDRLPDLAGKNSAQIYAALLRLNLVVEIQQFDTNEVAEGLFVGYANGRKIGDTLAAGASVIVYIAKPIIEVIRSIFISQYVEGSGSDRAIELYNPTESPIDLSEFALRIYLDGSQTAYTEILLSGDLDPHATYVLTHPLASAELQTSADRVETNLVFNGNDAIALSFTPTGDIVDLLGTIGWGLYYLNDQTLIRRTEIDTPTTTFDMGDWDVYANNQIGFLGTHPVDYPTTFTFDPSYLEIPFAEPGGMVEVEYSYIYDGDTAYFTPGFLGENRVRFIGIDTPEMNSGDPVAQAAKTFAMNRLSHATQIYLQHDPRSGNLDTYGRFLALIWVDGVLLNWEMVYHGYSQNNYADSEETLVFSGVSLNRWMANAEAHAKEARLGVWE